MTASSNRIAVAWMLAGLSLLSCAKSNDDLWAKAEGVKPDAEAQEINLAAGKFYTFDAEPMDQYPDLWPCKPWSKGTKLTDEETGDIRSKTLAVGWKDTDLVLTLDLGKQRSISKVSLHAIIDNVWKSGIPASVAVSLSLDGKTFDSAGKLDWNSGEGSSSAWGELSFDSSPARYVRLNLIRPESPCDNFLLDELQVLGEYISDWKYVPKEGAYHGAFNNDQTFYDEGIKTGFVTAFEKLVGKKTSMMLWYKGMRPDRLFDYIHETMGKYTAENRSPDDRRFFIYGWLPDDYKAADLAQGVLDENWTEYFRQVREYQASDEDYGPVWFRPANEMNGSWTNYSGDPVNYVRFWRRMYNIAEQFGITDYNVFVWAVSDITYNSGSAVKPNAKMKDYYPGDQYVDWIGASVYYHSRAAVPYPSYLLNELETISAVKPVMIAEGAFRAKQEGCDPVRWVDEWFSLDKTHPRVKCVIWFNMWGDTDDGRIQKQPAALELYRQKVQSPYWLDTIPQTVKSEIAERKARQNKDN